jgi:hypothetical protein
VSCRCIAAPLIIARPLGVSLLISNYKTSIKPIQGENALVTLVVYIYIICGYQTSCHHVIWHKTLLGKRLACLVDVVYQCIIVLSVTLLYFLGDRVSMHPCEADYTKPMVTMAKQDLKKF